MNSSEGSEEPLLCVICKARFLAYLGVFLVSLGNKPMKKIYENLYNESDLRVGSFYLVCSEKDG